MSSEVELADTLESLLNRFTREHDIEKYQHAALNYARTGKKILALPDHDRWALIAFMFTKLPDLRHHRIADPESLPARISTCVNVYDRLTRRLLGRKMRIPQAELRATLDWVTEETFSSLPMASLVGSIEKLAATEPLGPANREAIHRLAKLLLRYNEASVRKVGQRLQALLTEDSDEFPKLFEGNKTWTKRIRKLTEALPTSERITWGKVLSHAAASGSARPTKKWQTAAAGLINGLGADRFAELTVACLRFVLDENYKHEPLSSARNAEVVRGLVSMATTSNTETLLNCIGDMGELAFRRLPVVGASCPRVGNAVIVVLAEQPATAAISRLTALRNQVKHRQSRALIEKTLTEAAEKRGLTVAALEEQAAPTLGLDETGRLERKIGKFTAVIDPGKSSRAIIAWRSAKGVTQTSVPKSIKDSHAKALAKLRAEARAITKALQAQSGRLEAMLLQPEPRDLATWHERYLDHPLMQHMARNLIWEFATKSDKTLACWHDGRLRDATGKTVSFEKAAQVSLWHPITAEAQVVMHWRRFLEDREILQPFKQAHREVYLLTAAEKRTRTYSQRFAEHVLMQGQLAALCRERGWTSAVRLDSQNSPRRNFQSYSISAHYACESHDDNSGVLDSLACATTGRVTFSNEQGKRMPLSDVPERLFSEAMRDIDLFVGVCSIANDANWVRLQQGPFEGYWQTYSTDELAETAKTRRAVLERIVPKLKIADRLTLDKRFLVVKGDIRTYRIHLGSGNILMEPNNQYLCIVRDAGSRRKAVWLPFEGDGILALILSKAALLADDKKITDPEIVSQISATTAR